MRNCFIILLLVITASHCRPVRTLTVVSGPLVLSVWIYYNRDPQELVRVVDSSHCAYTMDVVHESDGYTRAEFSFQPDPSARRLRKLFERLRRYQGIRGFTTTRGRKE